MNMRLETTWISSSGGPLILMERQITQHWGGCFSSSSSGYDSDYDLACSIDDYIDVVTFNDRNIVILGDEPYDTSIHRVNDSTIILVRWRWAESESSIINALNHLQIDLFDATTRKVFATSNDGLILFDSVEAGTEISDSLDIPLGLLNTRFLQPFSSLMIKHHFYYINLLFETYCVLEPPLIAILRVVS